MTEELPDVCVVTHPLGPAGENATRSLLDILGAITTVSLVTADLPADSEIRDRHELVELTEKSAGTSVFTAAARFCLNQLRMCRVLARRDEPVILFFGATSYLIPIIFAQLLGRTVLVEPRGDVPLTLQLQWERRMPSAVARCLAEVVGLLERGGFVVADGVVTYTESMARQLGLDPKSSDVYPAGARYVRIDQFYPRIPFEDRDRLVGFLGRIDEEKGVRELAAAVPSLPEGVTVVFIGDGALREKVETRLADEREAGRVIFRGWVDHDEVPRELNQLQLVVLPSEPTEGLPTSILEALACGTPVLSTAVSGVPDLVRDGETGFLLAERTPGSIAEEIERAFDGDLEAVSQRGRKLIEAEYSFEAATERYRSILSDIG